MITKEWLLDAMNECETEPITAAKREKLAQIYIIYDHLYGFNQLKKSTTEKQKNIEISGKSDFMRLINGKDAASVLSVIDELILTIKIIQPNLYNAVIAKLRDIDF